MEITPEARALFERSNPGADLDMLMARNILCPKCLVVSPVEQKELAKKAMQRVLGEARMGIARDIARKN
jgi:hypothetical protein